MKISIITYLPEDCKNIDLAIQSVQRQSYTNWEHIIIDCGISGDVRVLHEKYPYLRILSLPNIDEVEARNYACKAMTGDLIGILDVDSYYNDGVFSSLIEECAKGTKFLMGDVIIRNKEKGHEFLNSPNIFLDKMLRHWEPNAYCYKPVGYFYPKEFQKKWIDKNKNSQIANLEFLLEVAKEELIKKVDIIIGFNEERYKTNTLPDHLRPNYWRPSTFPFMEKYLNDLEPNERQVFKDNRLAAYSIMQSNSNQTAKKMNQFSTVLEIRKTITVIIPTYNDTRLLGRAIDSVLCQDYPYLNILVVDDAGPGEGKQWVDNNYKNRCNVSALRHEKNKMLGGARNSGIEAATGDFICFLDADDVLIPGAIKKMMGIIQEYGADIVQGGTIRVNSDGQKFIFHAFDFCSDGGVDGVEHFANHKFASVAWNKIYCRKLFLDNNKLRFQEKIMHEDVSFSLRAAFSAKNIISISDPVVEYYCTKDSLTQSAPGRRNIESYLVVFFDLIKALNEFGISETGQTENLCKKIVWSHIGMDFVKKVISFQSNGFSIYEVIEDVFYKNFGLAGLGFTEVIKAFCLFSNSQLNSAHHKN